MKGKGGHMNKVKSSEAIKLNNDLMDTFIKIVEANGNNEGVILTPEDVIKVFAVMSEIMKLIQANI